MARPAGPLAGVAAMTPPSGSACGLAWWWSRRMFGWGAWQRRWIADDGLIVLRTVRNLLAGNGPVFNAGERVEANTSTVWTYLIYLGGLVSGPVRFEYVVLVLALVLSVLGVVFAMLGTARLYAPSLRVDGAAAARRGAGLHRGAARPRLRHLGARKRSGAGLSRPAVVADGAAGRRHCAPTPSRTPPTAAQRPGPPAIRRAPMRAPAPPAAVRRMPSADSLTPPGFRRGLERAGSPRVGADRRARAGHDAGRGRAAGGAALLIVVAGGLLPVGYQILRMGYYGLLFPGTAVAKDASGSKWPQGFDLSGQLQPALSAVGAGDPAGRLGGHGAGHPRAARGGCAAQDFAGLRLACAHGAKPCRRGGFHGRQRAAAGHLLDPPGRRLHARPGVADTAVLPAGAGGGDSDRAARRNPNGARRRVLVRRAPPACCGWRSPAGRCGRPTRRAWAPTPPASPTPASSTSAASTRRPPATRIR